MAAKGDFEPLGVLVGQRIIDVKSTVFDHTTGAKLYHYAAHHGNLKFLRFLLEAVAQPEEEDLFADSNPDKYHWVKEVDDFNCNIAHYAVR